MSEPDDAPSDLIAEIRTRRKEAWEKRESWIEEAKLCYGFAAGSGQWSDDDKRILEEQGRPTVTFDACGPTIDVVVGMEVGNRQETSFLPRKLGDAGKDDVLTGGAKWVRDECNAEDEESEAFWDMTITGEGWIETRLDYEYDPDGGVLMERTDPIEMLPDPTSLKKNYKNAEYLIREKMVDLEWAKDTWPDKEDDLDSQLKLWEPEDSNTANIDPHRNVIGDQYQSTGTRETTEWSKKQVKLIEYQRKKRKPIYRVQTQAGIQELKPEEFAALNLKAKEMGLPIKAVKQSKCEYWRAFVIGNVELEDMLCPDPNSFTYKAMTAKRDRNKGTWYGLVRGMIDPQRWSNKFLSQTMHIMNTNAKGGVMVESDAVENMQKFEESWARSDKVTVVRPGANTNNKIVPKVPPPFPPELPNLLTLAMQSIRTATGISQEILGMAETNQPASLEYQRKQAGLTILAPLFDALRKYRKEQGKNLLYLIETYISDGRLVKIVGQQNAQYVPLVRNPDTIRYDVIVDESPSSPNMKEKTWAILQTLIPVMKEAGVAIPPETLDYLPLPQSLIDSVKKPNPQVAQEQQQQKELATRERAADIGLKEAQAIKAKADAQASAAKIQADMNKTQGEQSLEQQSLQLDRQMKESEIALNNANAVAILAKAGEPADVAATELQRFELALKGKELDLKDKQLNLEFQIENKKLDQERELATQKTTTDYKVATVKNGGIDGDTHAKVMDHVAGQLDGLRDGIAQLGAAHKNLTQALMAPKNVVRDAKGKISGWTTGA